MSSWRSTARGWCRPCACARSTTSAPTRAARRCSSASPWAPSSAPTASARSPITPSPSPPTRRRRRPCAASARRPPTMPSRRGIDRVAETLGLDRLEVRRRNFIRAEEFPYLIPSGTTYDSGDYHTVVAKTVEHADWDALVAERDKLRAGGRAGRHRRRQLPGAQRRQLLLRAAAQPQEHHDHVDGVLPHHGRCAGRRSRSPSTPPRPARATRRWPPPPPARRSTSIPTASAWCAPPRWRACRATAPSAAAWRSCWAVPPITRPAELRDKLLAIAAHRLGVPAEQLRYRNGGVEDPATGRALEWIDLVTDRPSPLPPAAAGHGARALPSSHIMQVPTGGEPAHARRPRADVSLLLLRVPRRAGVDRPGDRQAADPPLRHRPRLRHGHQSRHRARHDARRHRPRHRRRAAGGIRLRRRGPAADPELHGLSAALGARGAGGRDRASRHAVAAHGVRAEGLGRVGLSRRAGRDLQRHQRCGAPARHPLRVAAHPHLRHRRRDCQAKGLP